MIIPKRSAETRYQVKNTSNVLNEILGVTDNTDAVIQFFKDTSDEYLKFMTLVPVWG